MGRETEPPKMSAKEKRQAAAKLKAGAVAKKEKGGTEGDSTAEVRNPLGPLGPLTNGAPAQCASDAV